MADLASALNTLKAYRDEQAATLTRMDQAIALITGQSPEGNTSVSVELPTGMNGGAAKPKRQMSASARKRIAAAQRARWATWHKAKGR